MSAALSKSAFSQASKTWLDISNLSVQFALGEGGLLRKQQGIIQAVSEVNLQMGKGQTIGLIGESGSGKAPWAARFCIWCAPRRAAWHSKAWT